jgi:hypothetical protein
MSLLQGNKTLNAARLISAAPLVLFVGCTNLLVTEKDEIALQHKMTV